MTKAPVFTPVLIGGCIILMLGFAIRASFGVFQIPIAEEFGWPRSEFSMAIAIQNLAWGIGQPMFGAIAERFGGRAIENSIPKIMRANPFPPVNSMVGPEGERWVPVHGFLPHSRLVEAWSRIQALFADHAEQPQRHGRAGA